MCPSKAGQGIEAQETSFCCTTTQSTIFPFALKFLPTAHTKPHQTVLPVHDYQPPALTTNTPVSPHPLPPHSHPTHESDYEYRQIGSVSGQTYPAFRFYLSFAPIWSLSSIPQHTMTLFPPWLCHLSPFHPFSQCLRPFTVPYIPFLLWLYLLNSPASLLPSLHQPSSPFSCPLITPLPSQSPNLHTLMLLNVWLLARNAVWAANKMIFKTWY